MSDERIKFATSIPSLKNKIKADIDPDAPPNIVYWYIKFNIPLNESTVSDKTMSVTDAEGYIMRTFISYDEKVNLIMITPLDSYEQGIYYILNISKKVKSHSGKHLKTKIHILFKLIGNQISEYKVLRSDAVIPKPKPRPANYEQRFASPKLYSFDKKILDSVPQNKLPSAPLHINFILPLVALTMTVAAIIVSNLPFILISIAMCLIAAVFMIIQISKPSTRSLISYNNGVRKFNRGKYNKAEISFKNALNQNEQNELAEYAYNKVKYYLDLKE